MTKPGLATITISGSLLLFRSQIASSSSPTREVAKSHIESNGPAPSQFDRILKRDLTAYFNKARGKGIVVYYKYLRQGATQVGASYPKYYLWVGLYRQKIILDAGAVRVASIDQGHFEVTHYLAAAEIRK